MTILKKGISLKELVHTLTKTSKEVMLKKAKSTDYLRGTVMIEILFAESEAGSMKAAKSTVLYSKTDGPTSVWIAGKKKPPKRKHSGWVEGTAEEVICLCYMLDIGDIQEEFDSQYRKNLIYSMYSQDQWGKDNQIDEDLKKVVDYYMQEMERLKAYLEAGEAIRIWYSDTPYSRCGLYHLCHVLRKYENEIHAVKLPEYVVHDKCITTYKNWGEVAAEGFAGFLPGERILSREEIRMSASLWSDLVEDNSPLRAVINGHLTGVPEDFYDFMIWNRITKKPVKECRLIGDILGYNHASIGDWWYAKRIQHYIETGKIKVLEDSDKLYARLICLA